MPTDAWDEQQSARSSNAGLEAWTARSNGGFAPRAVSKEDLNVQQQPAAPPVKPCNVISSGASAANVAAAAPPPSSRASSTADIRAAKAAGLAKKKAAQAALAAEEEAQRHAAKLWATAVDFVFDSSADPAAERCQDWRYLDGRTVLVVVPGFSSWSSITQTHVDRWNSAAILDAIAGDEKIGNAGRPAVGSIGFRWPCGNVRWTSEDAQVEAAAAWQEAHEATFAAARSLTSLLQHLKRRNCSVVVAAHSLGARVALQALANDLASPHIDGLLLLGSAVDNHALTGLSGGISKVNGVVCDGIGAVPAEFPFKRLMSKCATAVLAHSSTDPVLTSLWQAAEYARCGRSAPPALGAGGPTLEHLNESDTEAVDAVLILDVTAELSGDAASHDPIAYILTEGVKFALEASLLS